MLVTRRTFGLVMMSSVVLLGVEGGAAVAVGEGDTACGAGVGVVLQADVRRRAATAIAPLSLIEITCAPREIDSPVWKLCQEYSPCVGWLSQFC